MLVQLEVLKRALGVTGSGSDAALTEAEARAAAFVERQTGRRFGAAQERTEYVDGPGCDTIWLAGRIAGLPAATVEVAERIRRFGPEWTLLDEDAFEARERAIVRVDGQAFLRGAEYRIVYPDGFAAVPGDVQELVIELVTGMNDRASGASGIQSETIGDYSYSLAADALASAGALSANGRATIDRYRALHA